MCSINWRASTILGARGSSCTPSSSKSVSALVSLPKVSCARFAASSGIQRRDLTEDVGVQREFELEVAIAALDLVRLGIDGVIVRDRGYRNEDIGLLRPRHHGFVHVARSDHVNALHARWSGEHRCAGHERHLRAGLYRRLRDGVAHFPGALIRHSTHRVDRLIGRSCRDQDFFFGKCLGTERSRDFCEDLPGLEHPPHTTLAVGMVAFSRAEDAHAVGAQALDVALRRRVLPHLHVHRRRDHERAAARKAKRRKQVVAESVRDFGEEIGRCRRDHDDVPVARELDVAHAVGHARVPHIGVHRLAGERLKRRRCDEAAGRLGHHDAHVGAGLDEKARQLGRLVGGDSAGDPEQNPLSGNVRHRR